MSRYTLPDLPYDYGALEPHVSGRIMELHHDKHHRAYVDGANRTIDELLEARRRGDFATLPFLEHQLAFNVSGHVLHSIFWQNLSPEGGGEPTGTLGAAVARDFGDLDALKKQMEHAAASITGSGWAALVFDPILRRLGTTQVHDHQSQVTMGSLPLLVFDAWEHAYYLQYLNDKQRFFSSLWNIVDWDDVARRFLLAQRVDLGIEDVGERPEPEPPPLDTRH